MATVYDDDAADLSLVQDRAVTVLGYGDQGQAHALNLRDSGVDVRVGLREGSSSWERAESEGLRVLPAAQACAEADLLMVLAPVQQQRALFGEAIEPNLDEGDALLFGSAFAVRFGALRPPEGVDVGLVAAKGPGSQVRGEYVDGRGVPVLVAVEQDGSGHAWDVTLAYAAAIGGLRAGAIRTTFAEAAEADLFGAHAVLCGAVMELVQQGFTTLTDAGYQPEVAYLECLHGLKQVVDDLVAGGTARSRRSCSDAGEYGGFLAGPQVVDGHVRAGLQRVLDAVRDGSSARAFLDDQEAGAQQLARLRAAAVQHPIETVGEQLRARMPWLAGGHDGPGATSGW